MTARADARGGNPRRGGGGRSTLGTVRREAWSAVGTPLWKGPAVALSAPLAPAPPVATAPAVETRGLTKRYGRVVAVHSLDLTVPAGEVFGFLGPNGAATNLQTAEQARALLAGTTP